jgi:hypothetical protein
MFTYRKGIKLTSGGKSGIASSRSRIPPPEVPVTEFLAAVLAKALFGVLEALIMRLVSELFVAGYRRYHRSATASAMAM